MLKGRHGLLLVSLFAASCSSQTNREPTEPHSEHGHGPEAQFLKRFEHLSPGRPATEVMAELGDPTRRGEFQMPEGPFWGPAEGITNLVEPGTDVEEWVYDVEGSSYYFWFTGPTNARRLVATAVYPTDAVF